MADSAPHGLRDRSTLYQHVRLSIVALGFLSISIAASQTVACHKTSSTTMEQEVFHVALSLPLRMTNALEPAWYNIENGMELIGHRKTDSDI